MKKKTAAVIWLFLLAAVITVLFIVTRENVDEVEAPVSSGIGFASLEEALPAHGTQEQIIRHSAYILLYNEKYEQADWVVYRLTRDMVHGGIKRTNDFRPDPTVATSSATVNDYMRSGYDKGHLVPAGDMKWSQTAMSESFFMSNMSPQEPGFNRGIWENLESAVRAWADINEELYVVTGPVVVGDYRTIGENGVAVPLYYYKVLLDIKEPGLKGLGYILPNKPSRLPLSRYAVSIDSVESFTGIDFFPSLPDSFENILESGYQSDEWSLPSVEMKRDRI